MQAHHGEAGFGGLGFERQHGVNAAVVNIRHHDGAHAGLLGAAQGFEAVGPELFGVEMGVRVGEVHSLEGLSIEC